MSINVRLRRRPLIATIAAGMLLILSGCANPNAPSNANFSKGLARYLGKGSNGRICDTMSHGFPFDVFTVGSHFQYYNSESGNNVRIAEPTILHLHQLVFAHLASMANTRAPAEDTNGDTSLFPAVRYDLTALGRHLIYPGDATHNADICFANLIVSKVVSFTIPGQEHGQTVSTVRWRASAIPDANVAPLFKSGKLPFLQHLAERQSTISRTGKFVLTSLGWEYVSST
uniref:Lipoprotein n=1 Tax=mine drainage metagenome TaxID=410659 RepID=E6Q4I4_9ZZZZ